MSTPPARIADPGSGLPADHVLETLRAQPAIQRVPNPKLTLFASRGFLDPETCAAVIDLIDARRPPSPIADAHRAPARTAEGPGGTEGDGTCRYRWGSKTQK